MTKELIAIIITTDSYRYSIAIAVLDVLERNILYIASYI